MNKSTAPLPDWLAYRASTVPDRVALIAGDREWSYAALNRDTSAIARKLASAGISAHSRVAMLLHNGVDAALLIHAVIRLGAILVPLNTRLTADELAWQLKDCSPDLLVVERRTAGLISAARKQDNALVVVGMEAYTAHGLASLHALPEADVTLLDSHDRSDVLAIIYTSGTTGQPKGAMLTVGNFWWSAVGSALNIGTHTDDRWLACMPLFHVGGLSILLRSAIYGITAILHDGFDALTVNEAIDRQGVTLISVVALMLQRMLDTRGAAPYPPSLRCVLLGGGPAPRTLLERCAAMNVPVAQTYGLTETTSQVATLAPEDATRKIGAAGRAIYPNRIRIATDGRDARTGESGEILVSGPIVMAGYAGQPEATARAIVDGWLRTGDVGTLDADGYLHVVDRRDDLIITGGENVYPAEVEAVLLAHPDVIEAGVVGSADATWGQTVVAFVRLADLTAITAADVTYVLDAHCRSRLAAYKLPRKYHVVEKPLPRTASGKLKRNVLRDDQLNDIRDDNSDDNRDELRNVVL